MMVAAFMLLGAMVQTASPTSTQPNFSGVVPWAFACFFIPFIIVSVAIISAALRDNPEGGEEILPRLRFWRKERLPEEEQ